MCLEIAVLFCFASTMIPSPSKTRILTTIDGFGEPSHEFQNTFSIQRLKVNVPEPYRPAVLLQ